jgi:hypothetical protein
MSRARQELQAEESMSDVAVAFQQTSRIFEQRLNAALDLLTVFHEEQKRIDDLNGGDLVMTELRIQAANLLNLCGRNF